MKSYHSLLLFISFLFLNSTTNAQIIYVDANAVGTNDGTSWANAFTNLQSALPLGTAANQIWVADGTYKPHASNRATAFTPLAGTTIYGGFNGSETLLTQRNPTLNVATLSGDLLGNDNTNIIYSETTRQDNSYNIIMIAATALNVTVDGFVISGANGNGGAGVANTGAVAINAGYGMQITTFFNNVIFEKNTAVDAAVFRGFTTTFLNSNCIVEFNVTNSIIRNNSCTNLPVCSFVGTATNGSGQNVNSRVSGGFKNTLFHDNVSVSHAACIYNRNTNGSGSQSPLSVFNCTFTNNSGTSNRVVQMEYVSSSRFKNNIIYSNGPLTPIYMINSGTIATAWVNCIVNDAVFGLNQDPLFRDPANNDYRVDCSGNSPAIGGGTLSGVTLPSTDLAGDPRIVNTIDIGCYEYRPTIVVTPTSSTVCNGSSVTFSSTNGTGVIWSNGIVEGVPYSPTSTQTVTATGTNPNNCLQVVPITLTVPVIVNQTVTPATTNICSGGNVTITVANTESDIYYSLVNDATDAVVMGPTQGTGSPLNFNLTGITASTTYHVTAKKPTNVNGALDLDGVNDYVSMGTSNRGVVSTITVSARVRTTVTGTSQFIVDKYLSAGIGYYLFIDATGKASFQGRDVAGGIKSSGLSTTIVADNQWHEITGVVRSSGWEIWVDGVLQNSGSYSIGGAGLGTTAALLCGAFGSAYSPADIDQVAIWNTALSPAQILANVNTCLVGNEPNLSGYFKFDNGSGTIATDLSSTAVHGTLTNMTTPACWITGPLNACSQTCDLELSQLSTVLINDVTAPVPAVSSLPNVTGVCSVTSLTAPTATDNCVGTVSATHNATLPITSNSTITWTYNDGNGNTSTQTQQVVLSDVTAPVATVASLPNITAQCQVTSLTAPTATDNCAGTITGTRTVTLPITSTTTVTWTYNDGHGNTSTQNQQVVINDITAPVANVASLPNITAQCQVSSLTAPTATDNCVGTVTATHNAALPLTSSATVTWTYNDGQGNTSTQTQQVVINDITAPVANVATLPNITAQCQVTSLTAPTATDNCVGTVTATHNATLPLTSSATVIWTYNDGHGNTSTQTQQVVINDITAPVANVASLPNVTAQCQVTTLTAPTAADNCVGTITGTHNATLPITSNSTITWTYNDGNGNTSIQTQLVVFNDNTPPVANQASLTAVNSQCPVTNLTPPTATDNCSGTITGTNSVVFPISASTNVVWTYTDGSGNTVTQNQTVTINDITAPVPNVSILSAATGECSVTSLTAPTATDNCVGTITGTHNATLPITSNTTITWTYNDGHGNTSTQTQDIVLDDITAPVPDIASLSTVSAQCEVTSLTAPMATDACEGMITGTHNITLPIVTNTSIIWTFDDGNGNTSTQTQQVTLTDNVVPVADLATLPDLNGSCEITSLIAPTATDNCSGVISGTPNQTLPISATTTIVWTFDDGHGNSISQNQFVTINDNLDPIADLTTLTDIVSDCDVTSLVAPTATDNCSGTISGTHNAVLPITGNTTIIWTFTDNAGNDITQTQNVVITPLDNSVSVFENTITANLVADGYQWVDCTNGNAPVSGANGQAFTPTVNGSYAVQITVDNCTTTSNCTMISTIGIDEHTALNVTLYPNPTANIVTVDCSEEIQEIHLYTVLGELVSIVKGNTLSLGHLSTGVYLLEIYTSKGKVVKQAIKD